MSQVGEHRSGPIMARRFVAEKACEAHEGHTHNYDHTTLVLRGRILVIFKEKNAAGEYVEVSRQEYGWGERAPILAHRHHTIKPLEDDTVWDCEFLHRDFDGIAAERYVGNVRAYV